MKEAENEDQITVSNRRGEENDLRERLKEGTRTVRKRPRESNERD